MKLKVGLLKIRGVKPKELDPSRTVDLGQGERLNLILSVGETQYLTTLSIMHPTPNTVVCGLHGPAGESFALDLIPIKEDARRRAELQRGNDPAER